MCILPSSTLSSKYGHFWFQRNKDGDSHNAKGSHKVKASKTVVSKSMGDVTVGLALL